VVDVGKSELELLRTAGGAAGEPAPLARFTVGNLWVAFRCALALARPDALRHAGCAIRSPDACEPVNCTGLDELFP